MRETAGWLLVIFCTLGFWSTMVSALRHHRMPVHLSQLPGERFLAATVVNAIGCGWLVVTVLGSASGIGTRPLLLIGVALLAMNSTVAAVVLAVLGRSRLRQPGEWMMLDYVEDHLAPPTRPPETIEEYRAQWINHLLRGE